MMRRSHYGTATATSALRRGVVVAAAALLYAYAVQAGPSPACLQTLTLTPGESTYVVLANARVLIEEVGTDVEYRWNDASEFVSVTTPPDRLGFDVLIAQSKTLTLRARAGQGGGLVRLSSCLDESEIAFFNGLAKLQRHSLENGREAAKAAMPSLEYLRRWPLATTHLGWVSSAYANVLASAGENNAAEKTFLDSSRHWQSAGRADRAAIALMAAGDNASRANRFDDARAWLTQARDELERLGVTYYALRSEGSLCTVLSREGSYREALGCEDRLIPRWNTLQEKREAAVREISAANLQLRFGATEAAERYFVRAEAAETALPPLLRARLQTGLGNAALTRGDLPTAAARFGRAAALLSSYGLPTEQADLDIKLAHLAQLAGALPERLRLLDAASARLSEADAPLRVAEIVLLSAEARLQHGDPASALNSARRAATLCTARAHAECSNFALLIETRALIAIGELEAAQAKLNTVVQSARISAAPRRALLTAQLDLARGDAARALQQLQALSNTTSDPEFEAERTLLTATAFARQGLRAVARDHLRTTLLAQANDVARWPSAALRVSARGRLAQLQAALFEQALSDADKTVAPEDFAAVRTAVEAGAAVHLFAGAGSTTLSPAQRASVSTAVTGESFTGQRELFAALAATPAQAKPAPSLPPDMAQTGQPRSTATVLVLPLAGDEYFYLLTVQEGTPRRCLRWPLARYRDLATRFDAAIDGEMSELATLQEEAAGMHAVIRQCSHGGSVSAHWQVVLVPGTPALPWAWIAAAAVNPRDEPLVTNMLVADESAIPPLAPPANWLLLDLDMPNTAAALPFASREAGSLSAQLTLNNVRPLHVRAADLPADDVLKVMTSAPAVHVIGHANPAAFGQLYQGLWYESAGKPSLLTYPEIAALRINADLVVLSACGTRTAENQTGATSRLAEAFIAAGATHVVAASNPLSDAAAPFWTERFYRALASNNDVAAAARSARSALRASPHFRAPKFWAGIEHFAATTAGRIDPDSMKYQKSADEDSR